MHYVSWKSVRAITVCNGIATAMDRRVEHATAGNGASTPGRDRFGAPAGGETVCRRGGSKESSLSMRCVLSWVLS